MKTFFAALAVTAFALAATPQIAQAADKKPAQNKAAEKGEAQLAKLIAGRTAGKPRSCIPAQISTRLRVIDNTAIVYDAGKTLWVARPDDPRSLNTSDILVIKRYSSELCKQDVIHTVDRMSGFMTGVVFLNDFVPYTKE
jgi:hypothetical protein